MNQDAHVGMQAFYLPHRELSAFVLNLSTTFVTFAAWPRMDTT